MLTIPTSLLNREVRINTKFGKGKRVRALNCESWMNSNYVKLREEMRSLSGRIYLPSTLEGQCLKAQKEKEEAVKAD